MHYLTAAKLQQQQEYRFTQTYIEWCTPHTPTSSLLSDKQEKEEVLVISLFFLPRKSKFNKKNQINELMPVHTVSAHILIEFYLLARVSNIKSTFIRYLYFNQNILRREKQEKQSIEFCIRLSPCESMK